VGSVNVMCLYVGPATARTPDAADVLNAEYAEAGDGRLKAFAQRLNERMSAADRNDESQARVLVRDSVLALQAALLIRHSPPAVADAFCASRLSGEGGAFGTLPRGLDLRAIAERAVPN
jgi:putative acyl-CoA dehydrogenase